MSDGVTLASDRPADEDNLGRDNDGNTPDTAASLDDGSDFERPLGQDNGTKDLKLHQTTDGHGGKSNLICLVTMVASVKMNESAADPQSRV